MYYHMLFFLCGKFVHYMWQKKDKNEKYPLILKVFKCIIPFQIWIQLF
jgi:hypothetical protein